MGATKDGGQRSHGRDHLFTCLGLLSFLGCAHLTRTQLASDEVVILAVTHLHGEVLPYQGIGGLAKLGGWIEQERDRFGGKQVLVLAGGDHLRGSLLADLDNGRCVFEGLESLGVAAYGLGALDLEDPALPVYAQSSRAPFLLANPATDRTLPNQYRSVLLRAGDNLVGVTSVLDRSDKSGTPASWREALQKSAETLRREGADFVVAFAPAEKNSKPIRGVDLLLSTRELELGAETSANYATVFPGRAGVFAYSVVLSKSKPPHASGPHLVSAASSISRGVQSAIDKGLLRTREARAAPVGQLAASQPALNVIAEAARTQTGADVAILHPGAASGTWGSGSLAREALHQAVAIDEKLVVMTLSGQELSRLLRVVQSGARGTAVVAGLKIDALDIESPGKARDLNGDHKISHWEVDRVRRISMMDGKKFNLQRLYRVVIPEYLARGGDDLEWVISNLHPKQIQSSPLTLRSATEEHLKKSVLH